VTPKNSSGKKMTELASAATIKIPYEESDIQTGVSESQLKCGVWDDATEEWEILSTTVDSTNNTLTCQTTHFSSFGAVAATSGGTTAASSNSSSSSSSSSGGSAGISTVNTPIVATGSIKINSGAKETGSRNVVLTLNVNGIAEMAISNTADFKGSSFVPFVSSYNWTLADGAGVKDVYIKFKTTTGGIATEKVSITLTGTGTGVSVNPVVYGSSGQATSKSVAGAVSGLGQFTKRLGLNSRGADVVRLQKLLRQLGYFTYPSDTGTYGPATGAAVRKFQKANGISQVGVVGPATLEALNALSVVGAPVAPAAPAAPADKPTVVAVSGSAQFTKRLGLNSRGADVVRLQKLLRQLGYFTYPSDTGTYGPATGAAVRKFQKANGISQVGVVGPATLKALNSIQ
ncbi:MAG: peptidoglycan-binding protein, partial [Patescibacteria group bacterium]